MPKKATPKKIAEPVARTVEAPHENELRLVPIGSIGVDYNYQRQLDAGRVSAMAADFDLDTVASIRVNVRNNGAMYVIDGQHRLAALKALGFGDKDKVEVLVHHGMTPQEEAKAFATHNRARAVNVMAMWHARSAAKDPTVTEINQILQVNGLQIRYGTGPGHIQCPAVIESIFTSKSLATKNAFHSGLATRGRSVQRAKSGIRNTELLQSVLAAVVGGWGRDAENFQGVVMNAVASVLTYSNLGVEEVASTLRGYEGGVIRLVADGRMYSRAHGVRSHVGVAIAISTAYNKHKREDNRVELARLR